MIIKKQLGNITALFTTEEHSKITSFIVVPTNMVDKVLEDKLNVSYFTKYGNRQPDSMFQVAFLGDSPSRDFSSGMSYRNSETSKNMHLVKQEIKEENDFITLITYLEDNKGIKGKQVLRYKKGYDCLEIYNEVTNNSLEDKTLEYISSFSLDEITPFVIDNDPSTIILHRFRNHWSGEGHLESLPVSNFEMENTWSLYGIRMERFGQIGTMPARGFLPFVSLEDTLNNVTWAVQVEAPASWQIEVGYHTSGLHMSGGIADYNFGHFRKILKPNESFKTNKAYISVVNGSLLEASQKIIEYQNSLKVFKKSEEAMPIIYNDYLFTNGNPSLINEKKQIAICEKLGINTFVMDDGWFKNEVNNCGYLGDWVVNTKQFPGGLKEYAHEINKANMLAGIWIEFENVTIGSNASLKLNWMHTRNNILIKHEDRIFLDFRKKEVFDYYLNHIVNTLKESNVSYLKVDYNENIGLGVDGAESLGEGLRLHIEAVLMFYRKLKESLPNLVLEICSSGGMRHEPTFISLADMVSFSDIHEGVEGALCACNLQYFMAPRIMQVWATMRDYYNDDEIIYRMVQGMLGRLCLSGDLSVYGEDKLKIIKDGIDFYRKIAFIIKDSTTYHINTKNLNSYRFLHDSFSLLRGSKNKDYMLFYAFAVKAPIKDIEDTLPYNDYEIIASYGKGIFAIKDNIIIVKPNNYQTFASVFLLKRKGVE